MTRESSRERGYTWEWEKVRAVYLGRNPLCVLCKPRITAANEVDHIIPHRGDKELFWNVKNWQALCKSCHSKKTAREDGGFGNGVALPKISKPKNIQITIICGPSVELSLLHLDYAHSIDSIVIEPNRLIKGELYESTAKQRSLAIADRNRLLVEACVLERWDRVYLLVGGNRVIERKHWATIGECRLHSPPLDTCLKVIRDDKWGGKDWRSQSAMDWWQGFVSG